MPRPANKYVRFLTEEERNFHWVFLKEEENMSFAVQPQHKVKDAGKPSWGVLCFELKHKASDMHTMLMPRMEDESLLYNCKWQCFLLLMSCDPHKQAGDILLPVVCSSHY